VTAFLTTNAFLLLVPMMAEMLQLAKGSQPAGMVSEAFIARGETEAVFGVANIIPLGLAHMLGAFRPALFGVVRKIVNK